MSQLLTASGRVEHADGVVQGRADESAFRDNPR